jgi:hypothetical protein
MARDSFSSSVPDICGWWWGGVGTGEEGRKEQAGLAGGGRGLCVMCGALVRDRMITGCRCGSSLVLGAAHAGNTTHFAMDQV